MIADALKVRNALGIVSELLKHLVCDVVAFHDGEVMG